MASQIASSSPVTTFELTKLVCHFFKIHIRPNLRNNFCNHRRLEHFQMIHCISKPFGSRGGGIEILAMIGVQQCLLLAKSEHLRNAYV